MWWADCERERFEELEIYFPSARVAENNKKVLTFASDTLCVAITNSSSSPVLDVLDMLVRRICAECQQLNAMRVAGVTFVPALVAIGRHALYHLTASYGSFIIIRAKESSRPIAYLAAAKSNRKLLLIAAALLNNKHGRIM